MYISLVPDIIRDVFPSETSLSPVVSPIRLAQKDDLEGILELWGNSASLKQIQDSVRWSWKNRASQIWLEYAKKLLDREDFFLVVSDFKDNGYSGFMLGRLEELPLYYEASHAIRIEEFYIRPKDRKADLFQEMLEFMMKQVKERHALPVSTKFSLKIEALEQDKDLLQKLFLGKAKTSSVTLTLQV